MVIDHDHDRIVDRIVIRSADCIVALLEFALFGILALKEAEFLCAEQKNLDFLEILHSSVSVLVFAFGGPDRGGREP